MKDGRTSVKQGEALRRIALRDGRAYSIRPSFLMPYMTARIELSGGEAKAFRQPRRDGFAQRLATARAGIG